MAAKKTQKRKRPVRKSPVSPEALLERKIAQVCRQCSDPPCTGSHTSQGDEYPYTRAKEIFDYYHPVMESVGLNFRPVSLTTHQDRGAYRLEVTFGIFDVDTGCFREVQSAGLGNNGTWSLASAMTHARKIALLNTFNASWPASFGDVEVEDDGPGRSIWGESPQHVRGIMQEFFGNLSTQLAEIKAALPKRRTRKPK